jgi:hypothetical protein
MGTRWGGGLYDFFSSPCPLVSLSLYPLILFSHCQQLSYSTQQTADYQVGSILKFLEQINFKTSYVFIIKLSDKVHEKVPISKSQRL